MPGVTSRPPTSVVLDATAPTPTLPQRGPNGGREILYSSRNQSTWTGPSSPRDLAAVSAAAAASRGPS
jgi:hypothetical protein